MTTEEEEEGVGVGRGVCTKDGSLLLTISSWLSWLFEVGDRPDMGDR